MSENNVFSTKNRNLSEMEPGEKRMNYETVMTVLSQCNLGALLIDNTGEILAVNTAGDRLLHGEGKLPGKRLQDIAPLLCDKKDMASYTNIAFGEYLMRCPAPEVDDLPPHTELVTFRDATDSACHDMQIGSASCRERV